MREVAGAPSRKQRALGQAFLNHNTIIPESQYIDKEDPLFHRSACRCVCSDADWWLTMDQHATGAVWYMDRLHATGKRGRFRRGQTLLLNAINASGKGACVTSRIILLMVQREERASAPGQPYGRLPAALGERYGQTCGAIQRGGSRQKSKAGGRRVVA